MMYSILVDCFLSHSFLPLLWISLPCTLPFLLYPLILHFYHLLYDHLSSYLPPLLPPSLLLSYIHTFVLFYFYFPQTKVDNLRIMTKCINTTVLDNLFLSACCASYVSTKYLPYYGTWDLESRCKTVRTGTLTTCPVKPSNLPFQPPGVFTSDLSCNRITFLKEQSKSVDSVFDCTTLPVCKISCTGPNKSIIHSVCKRCSCMVEWLFNAVIFQVAGGIIVYLMMNFTRVMICRGVIMVLWRSLTKEEFEVKTTCSRSGEILLESANFWDRKVSKTEERVDVRDQENEDQIRIGIKENLSTLNHRNIDDNSDFCHGTNNNEFNSHPQSEERIEDDVVYERNIDDDDKEHNIRVRSRRSMREINERLENLIKCMVIRGWMYTFLGLALNAVWLVVLMKVQRSISYNPAA